MLKKHLGTAGLLLAIFSLGFMPAHATGATDAKRDALVAQLTKLADDWDKAIVRKDQAAIEANMAEDFRQIDASGDIETKTSFVNGLMSAKLEIDPYKVEDFEVRLYGNVALVSGRTRMKGRYDGKPFTSHYRYIDIYVQRDGKWQIVSVQISKIPQE
ncbi:MAG: nuclear transport factor 2 family protein [Undibacterium umbellatum]|uniref:nuclear transport factor 2 family protein n=1 Tax=Undibacterium umbellatum TaxID=2762300 RepID=UPI003BB4B342